MPPPLPPGTILAPPGCPPHPARWRAPAQDIALVPVPKKEDWIKAQKMLKRGWQFLGFACGDSFVFPSEKLLAEMPESAKDVAAKRQHISARLRARLISMPLISLPPTPPLPNP